MPYQREVFLRSIDCVPIILLKLHRACEWTYLNRERSKSRTHSVASLAVKIMRREDRHASLQVHVKIINTMFFYASVAKRR